MVDGDDLNKATISRYSSCDPFSWTDYFLPHENYEAFVGEMKLFFL